MIATLAAPAKPCHKCRQVTDRGRGKLREVFYYFKGQFKFDVTKAWKLVRDGRDPVEVDEESLQACLDDCRVDEEHVSHVNPDLPGLIAHAIVQLPDGQEFRGHVLIDGNHRATRCLRDQLPFRAFLLNEEESTKILLRSPMRLRPA
jgi:hypothetical protein